MFEGWVATGVLVIASYSGLIYDKLRVILRELERLNNSR